MWRAPGRQNARTRHLDVPSEKGSASCSEKIPNSKQNVGSAKTSQQKQRKGLLSLSLSTSVQWEGFPGRHLRSLGPPSLTLKWSEILFSFLYLVFISFSLFLSQSISFLFLFFFFFLSPSPLVFSFFFQFSSLPRYLTSLSNRNTMLMCSRLLELRLRLVCAEG